MSQGWSRWRTFLWVNLTLLGSLLAGACGSEQGDADEDSEIVTPTATESPVALPTRPPTTSLLTLQPGEVLPADVRSDQYAEYTAFVDQTVEEVNAFWESWFAENGEGPWSEPDIRGRPADGSNHTCSQREITFRGSFLCEEENYIALEESRQLLPLYLQVGPYAVALIIAHEHGHAAQPLLSIDHIRQRTRELQAQCFAGAWFAWSREHGALQDPEDPFRQAYDAMRTVVEGEDAVEFFDAFGEGFDGGSERCIELFPDEPTDN